MRDAHVQWLNFLVRKKISDPETELVGDLVAGGKLESDGGTKYVSRTEVIVNHCSIPWLCQSVTGIGTPLVNPSTIKLPR